ITPALIVGAFAERMKFSAFLIFSVLWSILIYSPLCHWVWGPGGWLLEAGDLDFAGGTVVHISSGTAALVAALMVGKRMGYGHEPMPPHNLPFTVAGAALLWVGWFGFNAGSALGANETAVLAFVNTNTSAAAGTVSWILIEWATRGKPTALGAASGLVAGLVAITPACGFVSPMAALIIGLAAGIICFYGIRLKEKLGADDALDVVGIHGLGGTWGALATGIFAIEALPNQILIQLEGVIVTIAWAGFGAYVLLKLTDLLVGLRVDEESERTGLDLSQHSERGYVLGSTGD
ncbi:MAG: ammonium transporter, partial [Deltaproteobacteria bacterium]